MSAYDCDEEKKMIVIVCVVYIEENQITGGHRHRCGLSLSDGEIKHARDPTVPQSRPRPGAYCNTYSVHVDVTYFDDGHYGTPYQRYFILFVNHPLSILPSFREPS
jgi:hypothetical protein